MPTRDLSWKTARTSEQLIGAMAKDVSDVRDPWARHWIVLSCDSAAEMVRQRWAQRTGISAHSQILNLRALLELPLSEDENLSFSLEKLNMGIATYLGKKVIDEKTLSHAKVIAEAIDLGLLSRTDIKYFQKSPLLKDLMASPVIKKLIEHHIGMVHDYKTKCEAWISSWKNKGGFPRIWIGLDAGLPAILWIRLQEFISCCPPDHLNIYQLSPSEVYWADLSVHRKDTNPDLQPGPLLKNFGKRLKDLHYQFTEDLAGEGDGGEEFELPPLESNLLGRLKECCHHVSLAEPLPMDVHDTSFQIHAARSPLRELEICRDRILQAMQDDPELLPEDVTVLLADTETYSPLVMAAFQPQKNVQQCLRFSLSSHCQPSASPFADCMSHLFKAILGRVQRQDLLHLLEDPLLAEHFQFNSKGNEMFQWLLDGHFSWGLNREHRLSQQHFDDPRWSLSFVMERLALGAICSPGDRGRILKLEPHETSPSKSNARDEMTSADHDHLNKGEKVSVPLERTSGIGIKALAGMAKLIHRLTEHHQSWNKNSSLNVIAWNNEVQKLMKDFFSKDQLNSQPEAVQFQASLSLLETQVKDQVEFTAKAYLKLLKPILENVGQRGSGSGGVRVNSLSHDAGLPSKMICVLGLSSENFPRREDRPPWHPLAGESKVGDADRREDDRHYLLLSLMSCQDRFMMSYLGGSDTHDRECPPSTPLSDMVEVARQCCGLEPHQPSPFIFRHGLNGFSPQSHAKDALASQQSYLTSEHKEAQALQQRSPKTLPGLWATPTQKDLSELTLRSDLRTLLREAPRLFLYQLGVWLPPEEESLEEGERLSCDGLQKYMMRKKILEQRITKADENMSIALWHASGLLPPNKIAEKAIQGISSGIPLIPDELTLEAFSVQGVITFPNQPSLKLELGLSEPWHVDQHGQVHHFSIRNDLKKSTYHRLELLVDWLCICWQKEDVNEAFIVTEKTKDSFSLKAPQKNTIPEFLFPLVQLQCLARQIPLPLWKETFNDMSGVNMKDRSSSEMLQSKFEDALNGGFHSFSPPSTRHVSRFAYRGIGDLYSWEGPAGLNLTPLSLKKGESLAKGLFVWLKDWEERVLEVVL